MNGGDDYELLFTARPNKTPKIPTSFHGLPLTPIGKITRGQKIQLMNSDGRLTRIKPAGWDPFSYAQQKDQVQTVTVGAIKTEVP